MRTVCSDCGGPWDFDFPHLHGEPVECPTCNGDMVVRDVDNPVVANPCPDCTLASSREEKP